jgi:aspartyl-tRNA(Asn)/glutamyl-tRNA(Gln) amidotransferase subunit C
MKVDDKLIADLSKLAKLKFNAEASKKIKADLNTMLTFVDEISRIETDSLEPLIYISNEVNVLRTDEIANKLSQKDTLKNSPKKDSDYFKVPTVLKK